MGYGSRIGTATRPSRTLIRPASSGANLWDDKKGRRADSKISAGMQTVAGTQTKQYKNKKQTVLIGPPPKQSCGRASCSKTESPTFFFFFEDFLARGGDILPTPFACAMLYTGRSLCLFGLVSFSGEAVPHFSRLAVPHSNFTEANTRNDNCDLEGERKSNIHVGPALSLTLFKLRCPFSTDGGKNVFIWLFWCQGRSSLLAWEGTSSRSFVS